MANEMMQQHDSARVNATHSSMQGQWRKAWQYYYGNHKKALTIGAKQKKDFNIFINYIRLAVDVKVAFLFGEPGKCLEFTTDGEAQGETAEEIWLKNVWEYNRKLTKLTKMGKNGHVCGTAYLMAKEPKAGQAFPEIVVLDPDIVQPFWDPDDVDRLEKVVIEYDAIRPDDGRLWGERKVIEQNDAGQWTITQHERDPEKDEFNEVETLIWPYSWNPVHHCQNVVDPNVFFGLSEIEPDVIRLNDAINFIVSNMNKIIFHHAHPKTWSTNAPADQLKTNVNGVIALDKDSTLNLLEVSGDMAQSIAFYNELRSAFKQISSTPEVALGGIDDPARVSSLALKVLYGPLLMQTGQKRITYGEMLEEFCRHLLEMGDKKWVGTRVQAVWPYVLPEDPETESRTLMNDQQLGVSKATALTKRGYKPEVEKANREAEQGENLSIGDQILRDFDAGGIPTTNDTNLANEDDEEGDS